MLTTITRSRRPCRMRRSTGRYAVTCGFTLTVRAAQSWNDWILRGAPIAGSTARCIRWIFRYCRLVQHYAARGSSYSVVLGSCSACPASSSAGEDCGCNSHYDGQLGRSCSQHRLTPATPAVSVIRDGPPSWEVKREAGASSLNAGAPPATESDEPQADATGNSREGG